MSLLLSETIMKNLVLLALLGYFATSEMSVNAIKVNIRTFKDEAKEEAKATEEKKDEKAEAKKEDDKKGEDAAAKDDAVKEAEKKAEDEEKKKGGEKKEEKKNGHHDGESRAVLSAHQGER